MLTWVCFSDIQNAIKSFGINFLRGGFFTKQSFILNESSVTSFDNVIGLSYASLFKVHFYRVNNVKLLS